MKRSRSGLRIDATSAGRAEKRRRSSTSSPSNVAALAAALGALAGRGSTSPPPTPSSIPGTPIPTSRPSSPPPLSSLDPVSQALQSLSPSFTPDPIALAQRAKAMLDALQSAVVGGKSVKPLRVYLGGRPGAGKTLSLQTLSEALSNPDSAFLSSHPDLAAKAGALRVKYINTMTKSSLAQVEAAVEAALKDSEPGITPVLLLDELDSLLSNTGLGGGKSGGSSGSGGGVKEDVLRPMGLAKGLRVHIIAAGNAISLPSRLRESSFKLISFAAYTSKDLEAILRSRLDSGALFHPEAITYIAKHALSSVGEARGALDTATSALEIATARSRPCEKHPGLPLCVTLSDVAAVVSKKLERHPEAILRDLKQPQHQVTLAALATVAPAKVMTVRGALNAWKRIPAKSRAGLAQTEEGSWMESVKFLLDQGLIADVAHDRAASGATAAPPLTGRSKIRLAISPSLLTATWEPSLPAALFLSAMARKNEQR